MITFSLAPERLDCCCCASVLAIFEICVSQRSVATRILCSGMFNDGFIANFPESMPVKEFGYSVENWSSYRYELGVSLFWNAVFRWMKLRHTKPTLYEGKASRSGLADLNQCDLNH